MKHCFIFLTILFLSQSSIIEQCFQCIEDKCIFLRTLHPHSKHEFLCVKNSQQIPINSPIILAEACTASECLCIHNKIERVLNKTQLCKSTQLKNYTLFTTSSGTVTANIPSFFCTCVLIILLVI